MFRRLQKFGKESFDLQISVEKEIENGVTFDYLSDALASHCVRRSLSIVIDLLILTSSEYIRGTRQPAHERSAPKQCHREYIYASANFRTEELYHLITEPPAIR